MSIRSHGLSNGQRRPSIKPECKRRTMASLGTNRTDRKGFLSPTAKPSGITGLITSVTLEGNHNVSYKESSGEHRSSSNRPSQCQEKVFGCFGHLGCPRLTLYEEVTQPESPQKECRGMCQNQPHAGVAPGWSRRNRGPQPSWCPNRTPAGTGGIPKRSFRDYGNEHWSPS
jgi:hypothetical protein